MADESRQYSRRAIRQLLLAAFSAEELQDLFFFSKIPELREVPNQFAPGDSYPTMVRKAVRYCDSRYLLAELLAEAKETNPRAYEKFEDTLRAPVSAASSQARPKWLVPALAAGAAAIVIAGAVILVLVLRGPGTTAEPTPTEVGQAAKTTTPTQTEPSTAMERTVETHAPEPTATSSSINTPAPTLTSLPDAERQFIVVYYGDDRVSLRSGPGTSFKVRAELEDGTLLRFDGGPEPVGDTRWWSIHTEEQLGWVAEWAGGIRLIKPYFEVGDTVQVANPMSTGNVNLWDDGCQDSVVLSRGTQVEVIGGPLLTLCEENAEDFPALTVRQWWKVETENGYQGWIADFSILSGGGSVQAVLLAPRWYVELTEQ